MIDKIIKVVTDYRNIPLELFNSKTRKREVVQARQEAQYFAKKLTKYSLQYIGLIICDKDHTTVMHSCKTIGNYIEVDKKYREEIYFIEKIINPATPENVINQLLSIEKKIIELIENSDPNDEKSIEGVELVVSKVKEIYEKNSLFLKQENETR